MSKPKQSGYANRLQQKKRKAENVQMGHAMKRFLNSREQLAESVNEETDGVEPHLNSSLSLSTASEMQEPSDFTMDEVDAAEVNSCQEGDVPCNCIICEQEIV